MAEPEFIPKPGQVNYRDIRYAPVVNILVIHAGKVLLVQRSADMHLYPNYWNGVSGFLDDHQSVEEKAAEELFEELGLGLDQIKSLERGTVLLQEAPEYDKTWFVVPVLARVETTELKLDWETQQAKWFEPSELGAVHLLPGFQPVLDQLLKMV